MGKITKQVGQKSQGIFKNNVSSSHKLASSIWGILYLVLGCFSSVCGLYFSIYGLNPIPFQFITLLHACAEGFDDAFPVTRHEQSVDEGIGCGVKRS